MVNKAKSRKVVQNFNHPKYLSDKNPLKTILTRIESVIHNNAKANIPCLLA